MPQHQGNILLPLGAKYVERLSHLPLACQRALDCAGTSPAAYHSDVYVLTWCGVMICSSATPEVLLTLLQCVHCRRDADLVYSPVPDFL